MGNCGGGGQLHEHSPLQYMRVSHLNREWWVSAAGIGCVPLSYSPIKILKKKSHKPKACDPGSEGISTRSAGTQDSSLLLWDGEAVE